MGGGDDDDDSSRSADHVDVVEDEGMDSRKRCKLDADLTQHSRKRRQISKNVGEDCLDSGKDCVDKCVDYRQAPKIATRASRRRKEAEVKDECVEAEMKVVETSCDDE